MLTPEPIDLAYEADLLGNIQQALAGLQGFDAMALELIQNADDAGATTLTFDVRDNALIVQNNGRFSTCGLGALRCPWEQTGGPDGLSRPCNFHAISRMGGRSKVHASGQIGRFGIGFVSVYQITDTPIIRSAGIEMRLEPLQGKAPTTAMADVGGTEFELPWAATVTPTRRALNASPTPSDVASLLRTAIASVMARGLLFLRHLQRVELQENGRLARVVTIHREGGLVALEIAPDAVVERWKLLTRDATDLANERGIFADYPTLAELDRSPAVHVAIPLSKEAVAGLLYAYLPTEQSSGMPLHINGDFFPHPNRRSIVLSGEQHERYWNELLLDTAAHAIGEAFEELRDLLGGLRLWTLGNAAFALRDTRGFSEFWTMFSKAAKAASSVWTVDEKWWKPNECHLAPEQLVSAEQSALANLGLKLLHQDLRPLWTVLSTVGVTQLKLSNVVDVLQARGQNPDISFNDPHLRSLWCAINVMIDLSRTAKGFNEVLKRLKAAMFLLDIDGDPASIDGLWRPPVGVRAEEIKLYVADCPLVHGEITRHAAIMDAIDIYCFDNLAEDLARTITDSSTAARIIGANGSAARRFYNLLTNFEVDRETTQAGETLADVPMLWSLDGFVSPSRGQLPGGFVDPIGHLALVDRTSMSDGMYQLALSVLGVPVLTFKEYVEAHLTDILAAGPTREQYAALLREILEHRAELDADDGLEPLAELAFVRTRAGNYARPDDCYYWSEGLEAILGDDGDHWVDEEWMPAGRPGSRLRDLLENRLGMRFTVATRHIVDRIAEIAESGTIDEIATRTTPIVRHILDRYPRYGPDDRHDLERLRSVAFLPAVVGGERVLGKRYPPTQVYRAFRASGFASQVPVVDLPPLRGGAGGSSLIEFLDLIGMPAEPPTEKIVAHLEHCMMSGSPAPDAIYAILHERLDAPDAGCIDRLVGTAFIYDGEFERYLSADKVFWIPPPFGGRWHTASSRMRQREALYRRLCVNNEPGGPNYSALLKEIAGLKQPSIDDVAVHSRCLAWLADALDRGLGHAKEAVDGLANEYSLLNLLGEPVWADDAVWVDSAWLVTPFGETLNERLVTPPSTHRTAVARLFKQMGVVPLSQIARLRLASVPIERSAAEATDRLRERADLLLWLAPGQVFRNVLRGILSRIEVRLTINLQVHAEIFEFDPPVRSPVSSVAAFYDAESAILYIRAAEGEPTDWSAAFRALFAQLESYAYGIDMPPVIMTAAFVTSLPTWAEAEQSLRHSDYRPPDESGDLPLGEALGDTPDTPVDEEEAPTADAEEAVQAQKGSTRGRANGEEEDELGGTGRADAGDEEEDEGTEHGEGISGSGVIQDRRVSKREPEDAFGSTAIAKDDPFKSKTPGAALGVDPDRGSPREAVGSGRDASPGATGGPKSGAETRRLETSTERQVRRSRMLAYAGARGDQADGTRRVGDDDDISELVDMAAIAAVLKYEQSRGRIPEEQPHGNPGYDIISRTADGTSRRLIEVKGLESEWTERGVKLSHVQYGMAERHPDEFWIYVVENARDLERQHVSAIANPFSKVEEYWFDHRWKDLSEESASAQDINIRIGARVSHSLWKIGTIVAVERRGFARMLTIDFGPLEGRRYIPYSSSLKFVD